MPNRQSYRKWKRQDVARRRQAAARMYLQGKGQKEIAARAGRRAENHLHRT